MLVARALGWASFVAAVAAIHAGPSWAATATADLKGKATASVSVSSAAAGVIVTVKAEGLSPGPHAIRFHETGKCEGDFSSAGGIFNPLGAEHGLLNEMGPMAGELPNIVAGSDGKAEAEILSPFVRLGKEDDATLDDDDGTAVLIFEKADDHLTGPDGGAGAPVACGILTFAP